MIDALATNVYPADLRTITQLARGIPPSRGGRRTHPSTLLRWARRGVVGPAGERIKLPLVRIGSH